MRFIYYIFVLIGSTFVLKGEYQSPLGLPIEITDLYISGEKVEPILRVDNRSSLVIRVTDIKPAEDGYRYSMTVYGLDPGSYNILDFLQYSDSKLPVSSKAIPLQITTIHGLDNLPKPEALNPKPPPKMGGYRALMITLSLFWLAILGLLVFYRKKKPQSEKGELPELTLQQKLAKLVTRASKGDLDDAEQAKLERLIIGHWKQELPEISKLPPAQALAKLREHNEASPLILKLEQWLHSPQPEINHEDLAPLLEPFGKTKANLE